MNKIKINGRNSVLELLRSKKNIRELFVKRTVKRDSKIDEIIKLAKQWGVRINYKEEKEMNRISSGGRHHGVIGVLLEDNKPNLIELIKRAVSQEGSLFIVVQEFSFAQNLGAVIRTAECAGADAVIISQKAKVTGDVYRVSMGGAELMPIVQEGLFSAIKKFKEYGIKVVGIETTGKKYYFQEDLRGHIALVVGGEDRGLSLEIQKKCDTIIKIPMKGKITSLNMSVAAGVVIYEKVRQDLT